MRAAEGRGTTGRRGQNDREAGTGGRKAGPGGRVRSGLCSSGLLSTRDGELLEEAARGAGAAERDKGRISVLGSDCALEQIAQRRCAVSLPGDIPELSGRNAVPCAPGRPCLGTGGTADPRCPRPPWGPEGAGRRRPHCGARGAGRGPGGGAAGAGGGAGLPVLTAAARRRAGAAWRRRGLMTRVVGAAVPGVAVPAVVAPGAMGLRAPR
ncbi:cuticle collagen 2-like [Corvus kubaryi]|uniref:cuticle collagen 2-like n=1 Tax=Corvus kubaryi TaxID=68294 RepID=UPI001C03F7AD|nr:cuticle collagen 2-like [Corvus kubaryi]